MQDVLRKSSDIKDKKSLQNLIKILRGEFQLTYTQVGEFVGISRNLAFRAYHWRL